MDVKIIDNDSYNFLNYSLIIEIFLIYPVRKPISPQLFLVVDEAKMLHKIPSSNQCGQPLHFHLIFSWMEGFFSIQYCLFKGRYCLTKTGHCYISINSSFQWHWMPIINCWHKLGGVRYTAQSPFSSVRYTAESPFPSVRYTAKSPFRGVSYTAEPTFCRISRRIF